MICTFSAKPPPLALPILIGQISSQLSTNSEGCSMLKVYIVGGDYNIATMFVRRGWEVVPYIDESVNLIQFTGGEDVDPSYYQETKHPRTYSNPKRDATEAAVFHEWKGVVPMAGICRGAQFLNVMNGGKMWQHVNNHALGTTHLAYCNLQKAYIEVTSTHHQMMRPAENANVLMVAHRATQRETATALVEGYEEDIEAVLYTLTHSLCFQPHPEYLPIDHECQDTYFKYLNTYLL